MGLPALRTAIATLARATLPDAKILRDKAAAVEVYLKRAREAGRIQNQASEIRLRAERRIGELLRASLRRGNPKGRTVRLLDLGISKTQSSRWQLISRLPESDFEKAIGQRELTTASVVRLANAHRRSQRRRGGPDAGGNILTGDMEQLWDHLNDSSIDLILTDPPYNEVDAYRSLGELAATKLKPGGMCLAYSGNYRLPEVLNAMAEHLDYYWLLAIRYEGPACAIHARQMKQKWKAILAFCRPPTRKHEWMADLIVGGKPEKNLHVWQQRQNESEYLIERLTERGQLVVDPFCGSGTVLAAAKTLGRRWLGCDIDAGSARVARKRVAA